MSVVAVVLTYRRRGPATEVVRALLDREDLDPRQVTLVVNGDGGLDDAHLEERIEVVRLPENVGPAGGFAHGLRHAAQVSEASWIYLCEDDQQRHGLPTPRLAELVGSAERYRLADRRHPIGAVLASGRRLDRRTGRTYRHDAGAWRARFEDVDHGPFWGALVSRRVVEERVVPDTSMFWGAEDLDLWLRVRSAGFRVVVDPIAHRAAGNKASSGEAWCGYYLARNGFHLSRRHGNLRWTVWHMLLSARRLQRAPSWEHRVAICRGLVDGVFRRTGRNPRFGR